ncbi:hypothetical protein CEE37_11925 [candidate division LCP-89 bacterium B3_LCP]|uniref:Sulfatase N-terminal domain-containing protein n=1 Tax=candidate division LCP-89 bacterium B3_LCP TaxID=2012998 RepID=A0A532UVZ7_UNCL8|nr:MAG: hypothetical protein CEE37_11925 [candidate division LCP-89 bacterium B3_LCP]
MPTTGTKYRLSISICIFISIAFLLWENLCNSLLGIYDLELRRTVWGFIYYIIVFLLLGGVAKLLDFLFRFVTPRHSWQKQSYVYLLFLILVILWGFIVPRFLNLASISSSEAHYALTILWIFGWIFFAWLINSYFSRKERNHKLPDSRKLLKYFMAAVLYLMLSTKCISQFITEVPLIVLIALPLLAIVSYAISAFLILFFPSKKNITISILLIPLCITVLITSFRMVSLSGNAPEQYSSSLTAEHTNVILLIFDAVRYDSFYDFYNQTKELSSLQGYKKVSEDYSCYATSSWTLPSVAALLTSRFPNEIGFCVGRDETYSKLANEFVTVAEIIQKNSYHTGMVSTNFYVSKNRNLTQGFEDHIELGPRGRTQLFLPFQSFFGNTDFENELAFQLGFINSSFMVGNWQSANKAGKRFLKSYQDEPFFLYIHYMDTHEPYWAKPFSGKILDYERLRMGYLQTTAPRKYRRAAIQKDTKTREMDKFIISERERYHGGIETIELAILDLVKSLKKMGLDKNTVIIVTSDHGEGFCEHNRLGHRKSLFQESLRVPLLILLPESLSDNFPERTYSVSLLDLPPTILDIMGIEEEMPEADGRSLLEQPKDSLSPLYSMLDAGAGGVKQWVKQWRSIQFGSYKYIQVTNINEGTSNKYLFNISEDSLETINLLKIETHIADSLATYLQIQLAKNYYATTRSKEPSKNSKERLRALGYIN